MTGNSFLAVNRRIEDERRVKFCGTASIRVASLKFRDSAQRTASSQNKNAESLKRIFREERGCRQEDNRHHAKAIISQQDLEAALANTQISVASLMADTLPYPKLELPSGTRLECLQGCDRLAAADEVLTGANKRWVVDLFLDDLSDELRRMILEDYDHQKVPDDGELYCKIREYQGIHGEENPFFERIWLGRLAVCENRRKCFDQLSRHKKYVAAFDALLDIPALFGGLRLSVVHQMISMKCDEPNIFYLKHVRKWWHDVCGGSRQIMRRIDRETVEALQGKAPGACSTDREALLALVRSGYIFSNFPEQQREVLWSKVCSASRQCLIPSLYTFFEDRKFLTCAADCMRRIADVGARDTITRRLEEMFTDANQQSDRCIVQISDITFGSIEGDAAARLDLGTRQLWLFAFRVYKDLPADTQKKDLLAKARAKADESVLFEFASLASRLGFESEKISKILQKSPDREIAKRALLAARNPGRYRYDNKEQRIQQMIDIFATATPVSPIEIPQHLEVNECVQLPKRYGIPQQLDQERDKAWLFLPKMDEHIETDQTNLTSFFIRRSVYLAYFGQPSSTEGCLPNPEATAHAVDMTDHPSPPNGSGLDREEQEERQPGAGEPTAKIGEEINIAMELDAKQDRLQDTLTHLEDEHARLDRRRELAKVEQGKKHDEKRSALDQLIAEEQDQLAELQRLAERQQEAKEKLDHLMQKVREEEERQRAEMVFVLRENPALDASEARAGDDEWRGASQEESQGEVVKARRGRRGTQFAFERLLNDKPFSEDTSENEGKKDQGSSPNEPKVHITFNVFEDGRLRVSDTLDVYPSDPSPVQRLAAKYLRKEFCLFDVHGNNLTPRKCFDSVTKNGTNTIVVMHVSQAGSVSKEARTSGDKEVRGGKRNKK